MLIYSDWVFFCQNVSAYVGFAVQKIQNECEWTLKFDPPEDPWKSHMAEMLRDCEDRVHGCSSQGNWGRVSVWRIICLMKEREHFEAVIKEKVICTMAYKKLCLYIFLCVCKTSGKNMLRKQENGSALCSRILLWRDETWANYRMSAKRKG